VLTRTRLPPQAARDLGISKTALKSACRNLGLERWPFRRLNDAAGSAHTVAPAADARAAAEARSRPPSARTSASAAAAASPRKRAAKVAGGALSALPAPARMQGRQGASGTGAPRGGGRAAAAPAPARRKALRAVQPMEPEAADEMDEARDGGVSNEDSESVGGEVPPSVGGTDSGGASGEEGSDERSFTPTFDCRGWPGHPHAGLGGYMDRAGSGSLGSSPLALGRSDYLHSARGGPTGAGVGGSYSMEPHGQQPLGPSPFHRHALTQHEAYRGAEPFRSEAFRPDVCRPEAGAYHDHHHHHQQSLQLQRAMQEHYPHTHPHHRGNPPDQLRHSGPPLDAYARQERLALADFCHGREGMDPSGEGCSALARHPLRALGHLHAGHAHGLEPLKVPRKSIVTLGRAALSSSDGDDTTVMHVRPLPSPRRPAPRPRRFPPRAACLPAPRPAAGAGLTAGGAGCGGRAQMTPSRATTRETRRSTSRGTSEASERPASEGPRRMTPARLRGPSTLATPVAAGMARSGDGRSMVGRWGRGVRRRPGRWRRGTRRHKASAATAPRPRRPRCTRRTARGSRRALRPCTWPATRRTPTRSILRGSTPGSGTTRMCR